jgi:hypothetical protein
MNRKMVSAPSIDEVMDRENEKEEYLINLKTKCQMQEEAFQVAESLIATYRS